MMNNAAALAAMMLRGLRVSRPVWLPLAAELERRPAVWPVKNANGF